MKKIKFSTLFKKHFIMTSIFTTFMFLILIIALLDFDLQADTYQPATTSFPDKTKPKPLMTNAGTVQQDFSGGESDEVASIDLDIGSTAWNKYSSSANISWTGKNSFTIIDPTQEGEIITSIYHSADANQNFEDILIYDLSQSYYAVNEIAGMNHPLTRIRFGASAENLSNWMSFQDFSALTPCFGKRIYFQAKYIIRDGQPVQNLWVDFFRFRWNTLFMVYNPDQKITGISGKLIEPDRSLIYMYHLDDYDLYNNTRTSQDFDLFYTDKPSKYEFTANNYQKTSGSISLPPTCPIFRTPDVVLTVILNPIITSPPTNPPPATNKKTLANKKCPLTSMSTAKLNKKIDKCITVRGKVKSVKKTYIIIKSASGSLRIYINKLQKMKFTKGQIIEVRGYLKKSQNYYLFPKKIVLF